MSHHPLAGKPVPRSMLVDVPRLVAAYYDVHPDPGAREQRVSFGTSGHRGVSSRASFNQDHVRAIAQAVCEHRRMRDITGPLYLGMDTHALSYPALCSVLEVLAANSVETIVQTGLGHTPTPVISHAIITHNRGRTERLADGIVVTPSHNPPDNGGIKYNPPHGGPAGTEATTWIEARANELLAEGNRGVSLVTVERALRASSTTERDFVAPYVDDLSSVVDMEAIRTAKLKLGVDPMGGSGLAFWEPIADRYGLDVDIVNADLDPDFRFMSVDHDGKVRMDCSSPHAMARLVELKDRYDVAFGNDPDYDRHGIVTPSGLMSPNHYLAVAVHHLLRNRPDWRGDAAVGKTLVSSSMIDRVVAGQGRTLCEVPVGFKWFVDGLSDGSLCFGGEESAGASFLRRDGTAWTTDKDGIVMDLLAAEITVRSGKDPQQVYDELAERFGAPVYERIDAPATADQKAVLSKLSPEAVSASTLAGEPIVAKLTAAPGNDAPIGGLKVVSESSWFAARPSGTEDVYKIYAESFRGREHLAEVQAEAREIVDDAFELALG